MSIVLNATRAVVSPLREFLRAEAGGGVPRLAATVAALAWADSYQDFWHTSPSIGPGSWAAAAA